jgi:hypothetical protein
VRRAGDQGGRAEQNACPGGLLRPGLGVKSRPPACVRLEFPGNLKRQTSKREFTGADAATKELIPGSSRAEAKIIAFYCNENHVAVSDSGMYSAESTYDFGASTNSEQRRANSAEAGTTSCC